MTFGCRCPATVAKTWFATSNILKQTASTRKVIPSELDLVGMSSSCLHFSDATRCCTKFIFYRALRLLIVFTPLLGCFVGSYDIFIWCFHRIWFKRRVSIWQLRKIFYRLPSNGDWNFVCLSFLITHLYYALAVGGGIKRYCDPSVCPSVCPMA